MHSVLQLSNVHCYNTTLNVHVPCRENILYVTVYTCMHNTFTVCNVVFPPPRQDAPTGIVIVACIGYIYVFVVMQYALRNVLVILGKV